MAAAGSCVLPGSLSQEGMELCALPLADLGSAQLPATTAQHSPGLGELRGCPPGSPSPGVHGF